MKRLLFMLVIAVALASVGLNSCKKDDTIVTRHPKVDPYTLDLVASQWRLTPGGIFSVDFLNIIPLNYAGASAKILLVNSDKTEPINQPIPFKDGELWATCFGTSVTVNYRGEPKNLTYVTIRVVIE